MTNLELAELLRRVGAAYEILGENRFKIIAYSRAADSIEHLTSEVKDVWGDNKLADIPGVGPALAGHIDELFRTGKVKHFDEVLGKLPSSIFLLLSVPGIGPKKAHKLVTTLHLAREKTVINDLEKAAKQHKIAIMEGFGEKSEEDILRGIETYRKGQIKENRISLPTADSLAQDIIGYLRQIAPTGRIDALGSLRRQVSTVGDIDLAVATTKPEAVIGHFVNYPHQEIIERGPTGASLRLHNGRQVDLRISEPGRYGAMLQYFTGSKHHNIQLREHALERGLSVNEYGIKDVKTKKLKEYETEEALYKALGLSYIPPELREDKGEIDAAKAGKLPDLVELKDIKGDLHIHTSFNVESSHDIGVNSLKEHLDRAVELKYEYIGLSDHNPSQSGHSKSDVVSIMKKRKEHYEQQLYSWQEKSNKRVQILIMCEVDILPDGSLALPEEALEYVDGVIVSIHSSFTQPPEEVTRRILRALGTSPKVRIMGHPTGRLLGKREGIDAHWQEIFSFCKERAIAMEINAYPDRLDLPDMLVYDARKAGIAFTIDTDSHALDHMNLMRYGVSVARRGWTTKRDILNSLPYNDFKKWLVKGE